MNILLLDNVIIIRALERYPDLVHATLSPLLDQANVLDPPCT